MKLEAIKGKAYITSAGEKSVHTGTSTPIGRHIISVCDFKTLHEDDGKNISGEYPDIIDEWPETTDAPEGHVNTAEIVYYGYKLVSDLSVNTGDVIESKNESSKWTVVDGGIYQRTRCDGILPFNLSRDKYKIVSRASKPVTQDEWTDWIGWNGGECPVGPNDIVETMYRNGGSFNCEGQSVRWNFSGAYRTLKAPVMTTVTLYGRDYGNGWVFGPVEPGIHKPGAEITLVFIDGVPQSIANVEAIK